MSSPPPSQGAVPITESRRDVPQQQAGGGGGHSHSTSFSRLWDRLASSSPTFASPFTAAGQATRGYHRHHHHHDDEGTATTQSVPIDSEPVVSRGATGSHAHPATGARVMSDSTSQPALAAGSVSGSWVPRWGYSKEQERQRRGDDSHGSSNFSMLDQSDDDDDDGALDGDEGVVVEDEACFVDGWEGKVDFLSSLPHEVSLYILLHLDVETLLVVSTVSKPWRSLAFDNVLWRDLFHRNKRWRVRAEVPFGDALETRCIFPPQSLPALAPPPLKRAGGSYSSRIMPMTALATTTSASSESSASNASPSRIGRRVNQVTSELSSLTLSSAPESRSTSRGLNETDDSAPLSPARRSTVSLAGEPSTLTFPAHAYASPPSSMRSSPGVGPGTLSRNASTSALSSLASSLTSAGAPGLAAPLTPSPITRRVSAASIPPLGPVPSPSLGLSRQPSAPLYLDWPKLYRDRYLLDLRWRKGQTKSTWLKGHTDSVYCIQFDERVVISGSRDQTIRIWDLRTAQCIKTLVAGHEGSVLCLQSDANILLSGSSDSRILVWDLVGDPGTGRGQYDVIRTLVGHHAGVLDLSLDDKWIASCSKDTTIKIWHKSTGDLWRTLSGHRGPVNGVQLLNDKVFSASGDSVMKMWDVQTGDVLRVFAGHERGLACLKLSLPSGRWLASGSNDKTIKIWDVETGECVRTMEGHTDLVRSLAIDEQAGRVVSASYDRTTRVWDLDSGEELHKLRGHTSLVFDVAFSATKILSCSHDQKILVADFGVGLDTSLFV